MYKPTYRITDFSLQLLTEISEVGEKIKSHPIKLPVILKLKKDANIHRAHASTSIEGNSLSLNQVNRLIHHQSIQSSAEEQTEVLNYFEGLKWITKNRATKPTISRIFSLHKIITKELLPKEKRGVFKAKSNAVIDEKRIVVFRPPSPAKTPQMMQELIDWIRKDTSCHPIIKSAITHHQLVTIHPFSDGNGRLARLISDWILYFYDYPLYKFLSVDNHFAGNRQTYYSKIQQARDLDYDLSYWIDYVSEGVLESLKKVHKKIRRLSPSGETTLSLTPKQATLIDLLEKNDTLSSKEFGTLLNVNRSRVNQLIKPLVEAGLITKDGQGPYVSYRLN